MIKIEFFRFLKQLRRLDFTLRSAAAATVLLVLFSYAITDFVQTASRKEHQIQESTLRSELGQFLLVTREPDGSSLLENPDEFSKAKRPAQIVSVRRPFFSYFLTKGNSKTFRSDSLRFDPPRACVLDFLPTLSQTESDKASVPLQACFAAIPSDPSGRYVYFSLRYPTSVIRQHVRGKPLEASDRVILHFLGKRDVTIALTYQRAPQLNGRRTSPAERYDGFHEVAGYLPDEGGRPTRLLNAQAFEKRASDDDNQVTLVGRIDASLLLPGDERLNDWPSFTVKAIKIGVEVFPALDTLVQSGSQNPLYSFAPGKEGTASFSLEQAYRIAVPSKATLDVSMRTPDGAAKLFWSSSSLEPSEPQRQKGWFQSIANHVAKALVANVPQVYATQDHHLSGLPPLIAKITEDVNIVPDIAARSVAWQFAAMVAIILLILLLWGGSTRLERLTRVARIASASREKAFAEYARSNDQIGTLGRMMHLLIERDRLRVARQRKRQEREDLRKAEAIRKEGEFLETRRELLQAMGHEIRSPLANLLARPDPDPDVARNLNRMKRAVNAFQEAATIEEGLLSGGVTARVEDLADFIAKYSDNLHRSGRPIVGHGLRKGVLAYFDSFVLENVLEHLFDNAERHAFPKSTIKVRWDDEGDLVRIEVFNRGDRIEDCESIFRLGVSDPDKGGQLGLGLYAAKMYLSGMGGTIYAENRDDGVAFIIHLQKSG